jgi:serine/threonine protein kinase
LITLVEGVHSIGCVHNDLKLDNICVGYPQPSDESEMHELKLIDFGLATSYVEKQSLFHEPKTAEDHIKLST